MTCPECQEPMKNLGNVSGIIITDYSEEPLQSCLETWVCHGCRIKKNHMTKLFPVAFDLSGYRDVTGVKP